METLVGLGQEARKNIFLKFYNLLIPFPFIWNQKKSLKKFWGRKPLSLLDPVP